MRLYSLARLYQTNRKKKRERTCASKKGTESKEKKTRKRQKRGSQGAEAQVRLVNVYRALKLRYDLV